MNPTQQFQDKFSALKLCVIIPTYNNAQTLRKVIEDVLEYTRNIIIIDDGSAIETKNILKSLSELIIVTNEVNRGKGFSLRRGFKKALELGYNFAITIDSDGQHFAKDIPVFIEMLEEDKEAIFIGARNMEQEGIPGKSTFGNKFSNFWFAVETGVTLPDTQSGYRLYPLLLLKGMKFITRKFEFEIEVMVRASWKGIAIKPVPVSVYYAPAGERVTHFRPFRDFLRISVLNTILVIVGVLYMRPKNFVIKLFKKKQFRKIVREQLLNPNESDFVKAFSIAFGVFMGIIPIWGFQLAAGIFFAFILKLNKPLVIIAANISIPPMIPLIIYLSFKMGEYAMGIHASAIIFDKNLTLEMMRANFTQYLYGSILLAIVSALIFGTFSFIILKFFRNRISLSR